MGDRWLKGLGLMVLAVLVWSGFALGGLAATETPRLFLPLTVELVDHTVLPRQTFEGLPVGGLSGLTYDRQEDRFYVICDDRQVPRFYGIKMGMGKGNQPQIQGVTVETMTVLKDFAGNPFAPQQLDAEAIALSPRRSLFMSSEGVFASQSPPRIGEFDPETGRLLTEIPVPQRFLFQADPPQGIRDNLGFEALTVSATSVLPDDPFRVFTAPETAIAQDMDLDNPPADPAVRWLHYVVNPIGPAVGVSENLYRLDPIVPGTFSHGLTAMLALPREGYFLTLERTFGLNGFGAKLFQTVYGNATDISRIDRLDPLPPGVSPMRKELLLDLATLGLDLDNLEAMTLGPRFPDGSASLWLVSDDNFSADQETQIWLFRLGGVS